MESNRRDIIAEYNEEAIVYGGLDGAIIGMASRINLGPVVAYDVDKIIEILMPQMELDEEDLKLPVEEQEGCKYVMAREHYEFNIIGGWLGEGTPVFIEKIEEE